MAGVASLDMDVDDTELLTMEVGGDGSIPAPDLSTLNKHILDGIEQSSEVPATNPIEDSNERMSRLIALRKRLSGADKESLPSEARKRTRSTSSINTSNSSPTPVSPIFTKEAKELVQRDRLFGIISVQN